MKNNLLCVFLAIPGMLLLFKVAPWNREGSSIVYTKDGSDTDSG